MRKLLFALIIFAAAVVAINYRVSADSNTRPLDEKALKMVEAGTYDFDKAHSFIGFRIKHMGLIEVPGYFRDFKGTVNFDAGDITKSTVEFTAKTTSVDTGVAARDNHLRTADFFDVEKFPEMKFKSTKVEKRGKSLVLTGDLTIKGITRTVSIPFEVTGWLPAGDRNPAKMGIAGETVINRRDFGVNWGGNLPSGVPALSDEVKVTLQIEAAKAKNPAN